jgi:hypothetical protein
MSYFVKPRRGKPVAQPVPKAAETLGERALEAGRSPRQQRRYDAGEVEEGATSGAQRKVTDAAFMEVWARYENWIISRRPRSPGEPIGYSLAREISSADAAAELGMCKRTFWRYARRIFPLETTEQGDDS